MSPKLTWTPVIIGLAAGASHWTIWGRIEPDDGCLRTTRSGLSIGHKAAVRGENDEGALFAIYTTDTYHARRKLHVLNLNGVVIVDRQHGRCGESAMCELNRN